MNTTPRRHDSIQKETEGLIVNKLYWSPKAFDYSLVSWERRGRDILLEFPISRHKHALRRKVWALHGWPSVRVSEFYDGARVILSCE